MTLILAFRPDHRRVKPLTLKYHGITVSGSTFKENGWLLSHFLFPVIFCGGGLLKERPGSQNGSRLAEGRAWEDENDFARYARRSLKMQLWSKIGQEEGWTWRWPAASAKRGEKLRAETGPWHEVMK